jgi:predicted nucleotidyltransferase
VSGPGDVVVPEDRWPRSLPAGHRSLLRRLLAGLRRRPEILGVAAGGSFAAGEMDAFSDLDLVVVVEPSARERTLAGRAALAAGLAPLLAAFTGEHVGEPRLLICLYGPPRVHVDLKFVAPEELAERVEDPVVLWDRDGRVREGLARGVAAYPAPDRQWIEDRFWVWIHYAAGKLGRGELFEVLDLLGFLRARVLGPLALAEAGARPNGVRRLETAAPARAEALRDTVAAHEPSGAARALFAAIRLYRELRALPEAARVVHRTEAEREATEELAAVARRLEGGDST